MFAISRPIDVLALSLEPSSVCLFYFICMHSWTSSGTMQREHCLFNQELRCVLSVSMLIAVQKIDSPFTVGDGSKLQPVILIYNAFLSQN
jgi:hypothetical protein